jgi:protein-disulfide isomerase
MDNFAFRLPRFARLCVLSAALLCAQDWRAAVSLPGVELDELAPAKREVVLKLLREHDCPCGCAMKLAECRVKDPNCYYSRGMAAVIVGALRQDRSESQAWDAAAASKFAHPPKPDTRLLSDPVSIPTEGSPVLGPKDAPITLVEFSDFQCPYCILAVPQLHALMQAYPTQLKLIFKQYPLDIHSQAAVAAAASLVAHKQGKFWPMHDSLFAQQGRLSRLTITSLAAKLGLDMQRFETDLASFEIQNTLVRDVEDGEKAGVLGTPALFIDGQRYNGNLTLDALKPVIDGKLKRP